jgi:DNA polymerase (family X)
MGGKAHGGKRIPFTKAHQLVEILKIEFYDSCSTVAVAGSIRRADPDNEGTFGDIDLVVIPRGKGIKLDRKLTKMFGTQKNGKPQTSGLIGDGYQLDVTRSFPELFPFAMLHCTGSVKFNILCRAYAKRKGFLLNQYGLFYAGVRAEVHPALTEREVLDSLGLSHFEDPISRSSV